MYLHFLLVAARAYWLARGGEIGRHFVGVSDRPADRTGAGPGWMVDIGWVTYVPIGGGIWAWGFCI